MIGLAWSYSRSKVESLTHESLYGDLTSGEGMKDEDEVYDNSGLSNRLVQALLGRTELAATRASNKECIIFNTTEERLAPPAQ